MSQYHTSITWGRNLTFIIFPESWQNSPRLQDSFLGSSSDFGVSALLRSPQSSRNLRRGRLSVFSYWLWQLLIIHVGYFKSICIYIYTLTIQFLKDQCTHTHGTRCLHGLSGRVQGTSFVQLIVYTVCVKVYQHTIHLYERTSNYLQKHCV